MIYKDFEIKKQDNDRYIILNKFKDLATKHDYKSVKEAKGVIDNVLLKEVGTNRYIPCHYRHYIWVIIDNVTHKYVEVQEGKVLKFTNRLDAINWCNSNQEKLNCIK